MKFIQKNSTSINKWLSLYKDTSKTYEEDIKDKRVRGRNTYDNVLDDLLVEQGYICAYCMRKISSENSTIEHIIGQEYIDEDKQDIGKKEDTNYQNMLAVCLGKYCKKITKAKEKLHCDSSRSNFQKKYKDKEAEEKNQVLPTYRPLLNVSPLNRQQMQQIGFTRTGVLFYKQPSFKEEEETMEEKEVRYDLNEVLNLNCINLQEDRKRIIKIIDISLRKHKYNKNFAQKELKLWKEKNNSYKEYCQVAIYKLEKFLMDK